MTPRETQKPVTFYLDETTYDWLTQDAQQQRVSRSAYLRNIVESLEGRPTGRPKEWQSSNSRTGCGCQTGPNNRSVGEAFCGASAYPRA